ncbi:MAG: UDP-N-acetylmuramoyl-L-alanine--D-glutamate ligase, partial [Acidimicrobiales bacterium]
MSATTELSSRSRVLVVGYGLHGRAVVAALTARDIEVVVVDDSPSEQALETAADAGVELRVSPDSDELRSLVKPASHLLPTPGLPAAHPVFAIAAERGVPVTSEFDLAGQWDDRPIVAITGTNGKTTVTTLVTQMLNAAGIASTMAGNMELPLVSAIDDPVAESFVVEASSFRLGHSATFSPAIGAWLNFAPDHLDVHGTLEAYEQAKARIWAHQPTDGIAIANAGDPAVLRNLPGRPTDLTFGADSIHAASEAGTLTVLGQSLGGVEDLPRPLPHDVENYLAAALVAMTAGASPSVVSRVFGEFRGLPHRMELVARADGISWFNDSKATTPHAVVAGVSGHRSVV